MLIICVAYNAIKLSDVAQNQLQSSGKRLGLINLNKEDKTSLVRLVAQCLLDKGYVKNGDILFFGQKETGAERVAMATPLRVSFCFFCDAHLWCQVSRTLL